METKQKGHDLSAKERHKLKLLEYLGNPEKEFPKRGHFPKILKVSKKTLYKNFTPLELGEIEREAVDIRKESSSRQRAAVLDSLYKRAVGFSHPEIKLHIFEGKIIETEVTKIYPPDKSAAQEFLDRTEGKVIEKREITGKDGKELAPILNVKLTGA